jgi:hypothetical protein
MTRIRIKDEFGIKEIAGRTVAGSTATLVGLVDGWVIAEVDGLSPYGHSGGQMVFAQEDYEVLN